MGIPQGSMLEPLVRHQIAVRKQRATCMLMMQKGANKESTIA